MSCRLCGRSNLCSVVDLGATPPCERFLRADQLDEQEITFPLHLRICENCLLLQIPALITPEDTFTEYAYYASYSTSWVAHARSFVNQATTRVGLDRGAFVVEVASNDGYLLQHVVDRGIRCLRVEPSVNVGDSARAKGVPNLTAYLDQPVAAQIRAEHGPADLVVANNVLAHVPDLIGFTKALRILLGDHGHLSIEVHHAQNLIADAQFDTIYHEHFQYFTVLTARRALATAGLTVVDVEMLSTHGGSIRIWARPDESGAVPGRSVGQALEAERDAGLHQLATYRQMSGRVANIRRELLQFLITCARDGRKVVGYGAPGKGNTLLNYCGIRSDLLPYTVDRNPYKQGRFTPGSRIPILAPEHIDHDRPDVVLVLPWNLRTELTEQLAPIAQWGGLLAFPLPVLSLVDPADRVLPVPIGAPS